MSRSVRILAALLLAVLLPVQGWAAACAQICARVNEERNAAAMMAAEHAMQHEDATADSDAPLDHCGKSEMGAGKCCQAHVFIVLMTPSFDPFTVASEHPAAFIARWTNFIPEEPSPPPIVSAQVA